MKKKIILSIVSTLAIIAFAADPEFSIRGTLDSEELQALRQAYRRSGETNLTLKQWAEATNAVRVVVAPEVRQTRQQRIWAITARIQSGKLTDEQLTQIEKDLGM